MDPYIMEHSPAFFRDLAYVFLAAIAGGFLAWRLRQPVIIGYVLAGILISPLTPGPSVRDVRTLELFAEIGVILDFAAAGGTRNADRPGSIWRSRARSTSTGWSTRCS